MTKKWNLQDIRPAEPRKPKKKQESLVLDENRPPEPKQMTDREQIPSVVIEDGTKRDNHHFIVSIILFVLIVGAAIVLSGTLGKTELTIYPKHKELSVNAEFAAFPDKRKDSLSYEIMTLETTGEGQVSATGQVQVEEQATGIIEIIKTTPNAERLIKNTRFRTPEGLIYRIQESVVVPGSIEKDGVTLPGTIQAEVFAEKAGEEYNIPAGTEFDIPGFEEGGYTALFKSITARNPEAFSGGYDGPQFQIDPNELSTARQALQIKLRDNLLSRVNPEKPADFIAFLDAVAITYNELPAIEYGQDLVTIREQAILQIPLFRSNELASFLAEQTVSTYNGEDIRIDNPDVFTFSYTSPTTSSSVIANETSLTFNLTAKPLFVWEYNTTNLTKDLAGLPKTAITNVVKAYPGIDMAKAHITPFWKRTFPENPEEIIVIEKLETEE